MNPIKCPHTMDILCPNFQIFVHQKSISWFPTIHTERSLNHLDFTCLLTHLMSKTFPHPRCFFPLEILYAEVLTGLYHSNQDKSIRTFKKILKVGIRSRLKVWLEIRYSWRRTWMSMSIPFSCLIAILIKDIVLSYFTYCMFPISKKKAFSRKVSTVHWFSG